MKRFLLTWTLLLAFLLALGIGLWIIVQLGFIAKSIDPVRGPIVYVILVISGVVAGGIAGASNEKVGGAPY